MQGAVPLDVAATADGGTESPGVSGVGQGTRRLQRRCGTDVPGCSPAATGNADAVRVVI